jgi:hypothetical protein
MVDTSAQFISDDISEEAWHAIATPSGAEVVDDSI